LINLKIVSATFGFGGVIAPIASPPGYAPVYDPVPFVKLVQKFLVAN